MLVLPARSGGDGWISVSKTGKVGLVFSATPYPFYCKKVLGYLLYFSQ